MALGVVIPAERSLLYIRALSDLTEQQLVFGFEKALKFFKPEYGKTFPTPAELREWAYEWRPQPIDPSRAILERGDKPPDWEQLTPEEIQTMITESTKHQMAIAEELYQAASQKVAAPDSPTMMSEAEFEARRQRQLELFRKKNNLAGEV